MTEQKRFEEIVESLVELKDTSELMIDLSYTALMLDSKELAEEVHRLEETVDQLHTDFELMVLTSDFKKEELLAKARKPAEDAMKLHPFIGGRCRRCPNVRYVVSTTSPSGIRRA
jgi:uncharacterized protein with PhoU and TrkA domain